MNMETLKRPPLWGKVLLVVLAVAAAAYLVILMNPHRTVQVAQSSNAAADAAANAVRTASASMNTDPVQALMSFAEGRALATLAGTSPDLLARAQEGVAKMSTRLRGGSVTSTAASTTAAPPPIPAKLEHNTNESMFAALSALG